MEKNNNEKEVRNAELIIPADERRTYPRIALSTTIKYSIIKKAEDKIEKSHDEMIKQGIDNLFNNNVKESQTINLSSSGLLITTDEKITQGSILHISMHIPLPGISCNCLMLGEVVRCEETEEKKFKVAVKFLKVIHHNLNKYRYSTLKEILNLDGPPIKID